MLSSQSCIFVTLLTGPTNFLYVVEKPSPTVVAVKTLKIIWLGFAAVVAEPLLLPGIA
jgi:hypothetical protein